MHQLFKKHQAVRVSRMMLILMLMFGMVLQFTRTASASANAHLVTGVATNDNLMGQASGFLPKSKFTIKSALAVDLTHHLAVLPLHKGYFDGMTVWYVITDVSDDGIAETLGLNFAPNLADIANGCPGCLEEVTSTSLLLGRGTTTFKGAPNFSWNRMQLEPHARRWPDRLPDPHGAAWLHC